MAEITDEESARAWLETQPHQVKIWLATRCALRALPALQWTPNAEDSELILENFRAVFFSAAASTCSTANVAMLENNAKSAANSIARFSRSAASFDFSPADSTTLAAASAILTILTAARDSTASDAIARGVAAVALSELAADSTSLSRASEATVSARSAARASSYSAATHDVHRTMEWPSLWHEAEMPGGLATGWESLRARLSQNSRIWGFWLEWYEAILNGRPLPWELSFRIATTLTDADWDIGPEHVAERIAEIRRAFDVSRAVSEFRASTATIDAEALRTRRGHNNPPELVEDAALVERTTIVWAALDDLEQEANAEAPDMSRARQALGLVKDWFVAVCRYLGRKVDLAIDTAIKWAIPAGGGYLVLNPDKLQKLIEVAEIWLAR